MKSPPDLASLPLFAPKIEPRALRARPTMLDVDRSQDCSILIDFPWAGSCRVFTPIVLVFQGAHYGSSAAHDESDSPICMLLIPIFEIPFLCSISDDQGETNDIHPGKFSQIFE